MPSDFVIRISLVRDETSLTELNPPVWRRFKVSSTVNLELLHDKILAPVMGWERNYHTYYFRKANPPMETFYVQQDSQASDAMHIGSNGVLRGATLLKPEDATIGDLLKETGDKCIYNYDLGDCFYHCLELEMIVPEEESDGKVTVMNGAMRCPNEDGDGSASYQAEILDRLLQCKERLHDTKLARKFAWDCFKRRGGLNVSGPFRPEDFDLNERRAALAKGLGSRNSTRNTTKTFSAGNMMGGDALSYALIGQISMVYKKEDDRFDHMGGFITMHETQNVKPDLKEFTLCYQCGSPNELKSCGRCHAAFYCSRECQTTHWSAGRHKKVCKREKATVEKYEKELANNKPDPNRFDINGGLILMNKYDPEKLRFKVGDKVECMIGPDKWGTGRIVKLLYREPKWPSSKPSAPYQIKLDRKTADREGIQPKFALIYSDWDDDLKIRRLP
mmetsp:Transcript_3102/g.6830  ORF Transcript_3102/g.6830 Transcript_3102/m.6830 type:complete len:447 (+) Transcript_3102:197-1537(+)